MLINEEIVSIKETGLFFEDKAALEAALNILNAAGIKFNKEAASVAFAKSEAYKIACHFENELVNNEMTAKVNLNDDDLTLIASNVLSESLNIDCFVDELTVSVTNEMMFTRLYS